MILSAVDVNVRSEGCEDPGTLAGGCGRAYIKVNGKEHSPKRRGFNIVVLDGVSGKNDYVIRKLNAIVGDQAKTTAEYVSYCVYRSREQRTFV